jgi:Mrp family chromosome partitioning ATPase
MIVVNTSGGCTRSWDCERVAQTDGGPYTFVVRSRGWADLRSRVVSGWRPLRIIHTIPRGGGSLAVLGAGSPVHGSRELLFSEEMNSALRTLRALHDVAFIDSPAVLEFSDAVKLAQMSDGAIIVTRLWHTGRSQLRAAAVSLRDAGANVSGVILTTSPPRRLSRIRHRRAGMR